MRLKMEVLIQKIRKELEVYQDHVSVHMNNYIEQYMQALQDEPEKEKAAAASQLRSLCEESKPLPWVYLQSAALQIDFRPEAMQEFLIKVRKCFGLTVYNKFFVFSQCSNLIFRYPVMDSMDNKIALERLLEWVCEYFEGKIAMGLMEIPDSERKQDLVIVVTGQLISPGHGPTKTALDRCVVLIRKMGKRVLLINTAEMMSSIGMVSWYKPHYGVYEPKFLEYEEQEWKGTRIPFYQCEPIVPDVEEYRALLTQVLRLKPCMVISIGGGGIFANICRKLVPTLAVGTFPSKLSPTLMRYQTLGRPIEDYDRVFLKRRGKSEDSVIEGVFTSSLIEETEIVFRQEWKIPDDAFVMVVVGARLDDEVTDEFLGMLESLIADDIFAVFVGCYDTYEETLKRYPVLEQHSRFLGFQKDMLAVCGQCDLYVNPHRRGGGTSCVEAMSKGVPVVTTAFGDVSVNVGEVFCVRDYDEMREQILRYCKNREFYSRMSELARKRAEALLDSDGEFVRIIHEVEHREFVRKIHKNAICKNVRIES